jgi:hypothetical protein
VIIDELMGLAATAPMPQVRALAEQRLRALHDRLATREGDAADRAHGTRLASEIRRFLERSMETTAAPAELAPPPGSPIGGSGG